MGITSYSGRVREKCCELRRERIFERWDYEEALYTDVAS